MILLPAAGFAGPATTSMLASWRWQDASSQEVAGIREQDTNWKRWPPRRSERPFNAQVCVEFRIFRDFSGSSIENGSPVRPRW